MENSLLRVTAARCPPSTKRDISRASNRTECVPQSRHPAQVRRNFCRRSVAHHDSTYLFDELWGGDILNDLPTTALKHRSSPRSECLADSYAYAASQLRLHPGALLKYRRSNDGIPPWDLVAEIHLISESTLRCPICLDLPMIPRMERCSHVYCGPCAIQYIRYENDFTSKKCAVCSWIMHMQDLKRVAITYVDALKVGSNLEMSLVRRSGIQIIPLTQNPSTRNSPHYCIFDRIVELTRSEVALSNLHDLESLNDLKTSYLNCGDTEQLAHINLLIDQLTDEVNIPKVDTCAALSTLATSDPSVENAEEVPHVYYQASDGRLIFLDGLMWSCLISEFGVPNLPQTLNVCVTSIRNQKMTYTSRKRWRHLSHVPDGHWFTFIEIDLNSLISPRVFEQFAVPLRARSVERNRKLLEDVELTQLKEAAENQIPHLRPGFVLAGHAELSDSPRHPTFGAESFPSLECSSAGLTPRCRPDGNSFGKPHSTFAEITKSGALSVVDRNRVANFSRNPTEAVSRKSFNPAAEWWPSLGTSSKPKSHDAIVPCSNDDNLPSTSLSHTRSRRRRKKPA